MKATIDFRPTCKRCGKHPRGKMQEANFKRYAPFCSYHCQEWFRLEEAQRYIKQRYPQGEERKP
jgi:hypothetical protein